jgi:hypothetical protein
LRQSRAVTIPTMKMRAGDFSELPVAIFDPASIVSDVHP